MILGGGDTTVGLIEQRRRLDKERLQRIKDPKTRTMGINTDALAAQVAAKQAAKQQEAVRNLAYDNERLMLDQQLAYLEQARPACGLTLALALALALSYNLNPASSRSGCERSARSTSASRSSGRRSRAWIRRGSSTSTTRAR